MKNRAKPWFSTVLDLFMLTGSLLGISKFAGRLATGDVKKSSKPATSVHPLSPAEIGRKCPSAGARNECLNSRATERMTSSSVHGMKHLSLAADKKGSHGKLNRVCCTRVAFPPTKPDPL